MMKNEKKENVGLNVLKSIAMFLVLYYHFRNFWMCRNFSTWNSYAQYGLLSLTACGVPLFFMINGALLLNKENIQWKLWGRKIVHMIAVVFVWSFMVGIWVYKFNHKDNWENFAGDLITGNGLNYLWFMKALIVVYMMFPVLWLAYHAVRGDENKKHAVGIYGFFLLFAAFGNNLLLMIMNVFQYMTTGQLVSDNGTKSFWSIFLPYYTGGGYAFPMAYFIVGGILYQYKIKTCINKYLMVFILAIVLMILTGYGYICTAALGGDEWYNVAGNSYSSILILFAVICIWELSRNLSISCVPIKKYFNVLGRSTLGIYFLHIPIGYELNRLLHVKCKLTYTGIAGALLFSFLILNICLLITVIMKKIPLLKRLIKL